MAKVIVVKEENYTTIDNGIFKDTRISFKAKGVLTTMLSLPPTWNYTIEGLATLSKDGRDSIKTALKELENFGYLERKQVRNDNGSFCDLEYFVYEKSRLKEPLAENPPTDKPPAENIEQLNINILSTDKLNTDNSLSNDKVEKKKRKINSPKGELNNSFSVEKKLTGQDTRNDITEKELEEIVNLMPIRAMKIAYEKTQEENIAKNVYNCFRYFLAKHKEVIGTRHKVLSDETIDRVVGIITNGIDIKQAGYANVYEPLVTKYEDDNDYEIVIDEYFKTKFKRKNCDYSIVHFASESILTNMMNHVGKENWCTCI